MHRIPIIQSLFDAARLSRQSGGSIHLTCYYYSIYPDGAVRESNNVVTSVLGNPLYIACCTVHEYNTLYGKPIDSEIFCFVNRSGEPSNNLTLSKWSLQDIRLFQNSIVDGASMRLLGDPSQVFTLEYESGSPIRSFQTLWTLFLEIDANCSTVKEAEFYLKYFVEKLELNDTSFTLQQYRDQLADARDLIHRYNSLLEKISRLVQETADRNA